MIKAIAILLCLFLLLPAAIVEAGNSNTIITAGPSWKRFTNKDGRGLYHDIIKKIYSDYTVEHIYAPSVQANSLVAIGRADIRMCETETEESLILARYPMYENSFYVVYLKEKEEPWRGTSSYEGKQMVWREGYYNQADFMVPVDFIEVRSGESALKMVMLGRADFYVDDLKLIEQSFELIGEELNLRKYGVQKVGKRQYFPVFAKNMRGEKLRKHYEKELEKLYNEGSLQQIYRLWDFPVPQFNFDASSK